MHNILKYFPNLNDEQIHQFDTLKGLYDEWNAKINVISRKDMAQFYTNHVLHSLGIANAITFKSGTNILDVGTGGGFPGVPLAIMFPDCQFHLVDSINKKLKVVNAVCQAIELNNVRTTHTRVERINNHYDFIVSRAVTTMPNFVAWVNKKVSKTQKNDLKNGILYLKGGDLSKELKAFKNAKLFQLKDYFEEPFFETKKVVHLPFD